MWKGVELSFKKWLANIIMDWLSENSDAGEKEIIIAQGHSMPVSELRQIQDEWVRAGIIR